MRSCCALLSALALGLLVCAGGCGQSTTSVKPSDVPDAADYDKQFEQQGEVDAARPEAPDTSGGGGDESGGEGESEDQ